jgi:DNA-binding PadR family transcriptional regulator
MTKGTSTRVFILSQLARGAAHGHRIRREAVGRRAALSADVAVGSIYATLGRLEAEGLIRAARTEREGRFPERTVFAITGDGRKALKALRAAALREVALPADPFNLALSAADDLYPAELLPIVEERLAQLRQQRRLLEQRRRAAAPQMAKVDQIMYEHLAKRLDAEIDWHDRVRVQLPEISA